MRNSDRTLRHGHITKQGSPWVGWILQEAAQTAKRSPLFADTYGQLAHRRGRNIATVAIARHLLARSFHRHATPAPGSEWVHASPLRDVVRAFSSTILCRSSPASRSVLHQGAPP